MNAVSSRKTYRTTRSPVARQEAFYGYLFIAPAVLGFLIWVAGPMLVSAWLSLTEWDLLSPPEFVGLSNYQAMFQDALLGFACTGDPSTSALAWPAYAPPQRATIILDRTSMVQDAPREAERRFWESVLSG